MPGNDDIIDEIPLAECTEVKIPRMNEADPFEHIEDGNQYSHCLQVVLGTVFVLFLLFRSRVSISKSTSAVHVRLKQSWTATTLVDIIF